MKGDHGLGECQFCYEKDAEVARLTNKVKSQNETIEFLREIYKDPSPDVQETVIKKLNLVSGEGYDVLKVENSRLRSALDKVVKHWDKVTWDENEEFEWTRILVNLKEALADQSSKGKGDGV